MRVTPVITGTAHWKSAKSFSSTPDGASVTPMDGTLGVATIWLVRSPPGGVSCTDATFTNGTTAGTGTGWPVGGVGCPGGGTESGVGGGGTGCPR